MLFARPHRARLREATTPSMTDLTPGTAKGLFPSGVFAHVYARSSLECRSNGSANNDIVARVGVSLARSDDTAR